jgi:hypothetical protein
MVIGSVLASACALAIGRVRPAAAVRPIPVEVPQA